VEELLLEPRATAGRDDPAAREKARDEWQRDVDADREQQRLPGHRESADAEQIAAERRSDDIVVLSVHWGGNWGYRVLKRHRLFAHYLIDSGVVDIVHGHSSHHAKGLEYYKGKIILYGCGDFVNDYEGIGGREEFRPWLAPMYFVTVNLRSRQIEHVEIEVMRMRRFRLQKAAAKDRQWFGDKLHQVSKGFATCVDSSNERLLAGPCATPQPSS